MSKRNRIAVDQFNKGSDVLSRDLDIRNIVKTKSSVQVLHNLILRNKFQKMLFYGQRQHFLNLKSDTDSNTKVINFGSIDLKSISTDLVNKEYNTPFERRLILGLMSRDYNLEDEKEVIAGVPQGNFRNKAYES